ncbi:MAG: hypothetical protein LC803_16685 [Acidobacteria bacterium]|nr:hypothetical protein [Acidobacteriota bacterium]
MNTSPRETNDNSRDRLSLVAFSFITAAAWAAGCVALYGLATLANYGF